MTWTVLSTWIILSFLWTLFFLSSLPDNASSLELRRDLRSLRKEKSLRILLLQLLRSEVKGWRAIFANSGSSRRLRGKSSVRVIRLSTYWSAGFFEVVRWWDWSKQKEIPKPSASLQHFTFRNKTWPENTKERALKWLNHKMLKKIFAKDWQAMLLLMLRMLGFRKRENFFCQNF